MSLDLDTEMLLERWLHGEARPTERQTVRERLKADPAFAAAMVTRALEIERIRSLLPRRSGSPRAVTARVRRIVRPPTSVWRYAAVVVAALLLIAIGGMWGSWSDSSTATPAVPTVARLELPLSVPRQDGIAIVGPAPLFLRSANGLEVTLAPGSRVALDPSTAVLDLRQGQADISVPHQTPGASLRFLTPQLEATIVGTRFTLVVDSVSTLRVHEGIVQARDLRTGHIQAVAADDDLTAGALAQWHFTDKELDGVRILTDGQWLPPTAGEPAAIKGVSVADNVMLLRLLLPATPVVRWDDVGAVELEIDGVGDCFVNAMGEIGNGIGLAQTPTTLIAGWRLLRIPAANFTVADHAWTIRRFTLSQPSNGSLRLRSLTFLPRIGGAPAVPAPVAP